MAEQAPKKSSFTQRFYDAKRRVTQSVLEKVGKAEPTPDTEYEERKARALELFKLLTSAKHHITNYIDATRSLCFASSELGGDFMKLFQGGDAGVEDAGKRFNDSMSTVDEQTRKTMDDKIVGQVLETFDEKLEQFAELRAMMKAREQLKIDFDAYTRNVRSLKEKASKNIKKLSDKETKLANCKAQLEDATAELFWRFDGMEDARPTMLLKEFRIFVEANTGFFAEASQLLNNVGTVPHAEPPAARAKPVVTYNPPTAVAAASTAPTKSGGKEEEPPAPAAAASGVERCKALFAYAPQSDDELALAEGDIVEVLAKQDDGWWNGRIGKRTGVFPSNYVGPV